jgi:DNA-binding Xre family transcriptional regulator
MIMFRIQEFARTRKIQTKKGVRPIENVYLFAKAIGKPETMAKRLWLGTLTRLDIGVLDEVCEALDCEPGDLLVRAPKKSGDRKRK